MHIMVDDWQVQAMGDEFQVSTRLTEAAVDLVSLVEDKLKCSLADHKAKVVGTCESKLGRIRRALGPRAGELPDCSEPLLGVDYMGGRPRKLAGRMSKRWHRITAQQKMANKVGKLKKILHERAVGIYRAGPMAAAQYGANVWGTDDQEMWAMHTQALATMSPTASGRSRPPTLLLSRDPTWRPAVEPIMQWVTIIWKLANDLSPGKRAKAHGIAHQCVESDGEAAPNQVASSQRANGCAGDGYGKIWMGAKGPLQITDLQGLERPILSVSPNMWASLAHIDWHKRMGMQVCKKVGLQQGQRLLLDDVSSSLGKKFALTEHQKACLKSYWCGAMWTRYRVNQAEMQNVPLACPLCGRHKDTLARRIWCCEHELVRQERNKLFSRHEIEQARAHIFENEFEEDQVSSYAGLKLGKFMGAMVGPSDAAPTPDQSGAMVTWTASGRPFAEVARGLWMFIDGSAERKACAELSRAAWAVVVIGEAGNMEGHVRGPVWASVGNRHLERQNWSPLLQRWTWRTAATRWRQTTSPRSRSRSRARRGSCTRATCTGASSRRPRRTTGCRT